MPDPIAQDYLSMVPSTRSAIVLGLLLVPSLAHAHNLTPSELTVTADFFALGTEHLWGGWDHLAFLAALLLPGGSASRLIQIVTGFTLSHSITLALAATGRLTVPGFVEPLIALTIVVVALEALSPRPRLGPPVDRRFEWALAFGLVHGTWGVPVNRILPALLGFNLGVETAQLVVIAAAYPLLVWLGTWEGRRRDTAVRVGAWVLAGWGGVWLVQRISGGLL